MKRILELDDSGKWIGRCVKDVMRAHFRMSGNLIKRLKAANAITVNDSPVRVTYIIKPGDRLRFIISDDAPGSAAPVPMDIDIVWEDEDLLVINKAPGIATHTSPGHYGDTLANGLAAIYGEDFVFRAVNRLDKDTSGLLIVAKNSYAHELLIRRLHTDSFRREYCALAAGDLSGSGVIELPIARCPDSIIKRQVAPGGQYAKTAYESLASSGRVSLVKLRLYTGRTHQIRVHLSAIGHPIIGDWLYGQPSPFIGRQALHSMNIFLLHPVTNRELSLSAPLPKDMAECFETLAGQGIPSDI